MSGTLDNFEDAMAALRRDGASFIICQRRKIPKGGGIIYKVQGELHNPPCADEILAMAEAVDGYCQEISDENDREGNDGR